MKVKTNLKLNKKKKVTKDGIQKIPYIKANTCQCEIIANRMGQYLCDLYAEQVNNIYNI